MPTRYCMSCGCGTNYASTKPVKCQKCDKIFDNPNISLKVEIRENNSISSVFKHPTHVDPNLTEEQSQLIKGKEALARFGLEPMGEEDVIIRGTDSFTFKDVIKEGLESAPYHEQAKPTPAKRGRKSTKTSE